MAVQKDFRVLYQAKANATGLADVKAQIYLNGVAKAVGGSALALTEVDAVNSPGLYELRILAATLVSFGVVAGSLNTLEGYIDSASKSAKAPFRAELTVSSNDDVEAHLVLQDTAIAAVKTDTAAIKTDLETGPASLANLLAALQVIQSNAGFAVPVPATLQRPGTGSNNYRFPVTIYDEANNLIDPTGSVITVSMVNQAGADRAIYLVGSASGTVAATRDSIGQYHVDVSIPSTASEEQLIVNFAYTINGKATARKATTEILNDVEADGFALESTLQSVKTTAESTNGVVTSATFGNAALQALLANGTYGLSALQSLLANGTYGLSALQGILTNATYGLPQIKSVLSDATYGNAALQLQGAATQGTGFVAGTDDLHAFSTFVRLNLYQGGRAV